MKIFFMVAMLALVGSIAHAASIGIIVRNPSGTLIAGATVYALYMSPTGPDASISTMTLTDATGKAQFDTLPNGTRYDFYVAAGGFGPSVIRQSQGQAPHPVAVVNGTMADQTHTFTETLANRGTIVANVTNATAHKMIFGQVAKGNYGAAFGACQTKEGGDCEFFFVNVASDVANVYNAGMFDPVQGIGAGNIVAASVETGAATAVNVDFANGQAPDNTASGGSQNQQQQQNQQQAQGGVSVEGNVHEVNFPTATVQHVGISLQACGNPPACTNYYDRGWVNTDDNGHYRFFNLDAGTTYFLRVMGGCSWNNGETSCYDGFVSTGAQVGSPQPSLPNDFLYSGVPTYHNITLNRTAPGTNSLRVYAKHADGTPVYQSWIMIGDDNDRWHANSGTSHDWTACSSGGGNDAGDASNAPLVGWLNAQASTGTARFNDLRPGNYRISVCTGGGCKTFNDGANGQVMSNNGGNQGQWTFPGCGDKSDDLRVGIASNGVFRIFNSSGLIVHTSTATDYVGTSSVTVVLPTAPEGTYRLHGNLTFPTIASLSNDPISIALHGQWNNNGQVCEFNTVIGDDEAPASSYSYEVRPSSWQACSNSDIAGTIQYWLETAAGYWGVVRKESGDSGSVIFAGTDTVRKDFVFAPAGKWIGKIYKSDGSLFTRSNKQQNYLTIAVSARPLDGHGWGGQYPSNEDGTFAQGGLLPGKYKQAVQIWGNSDGSFTLPDPAPTFEIKPGQDTYQDIKFVESTWLAFNVATTSPKLPTLTNTMTPYGWCMGDCWKALKQSAGTKLDFAKVQSLLVNDEEDAEFRISPRAPSSNCNSGPWIGGTASNLSGWCPRQAPKGSTYDVYFLRSGQGKKKGYEDVANEYNYFTVVGSSKNIIVDSAHATTPQVCNGSYMYAGGNPNDPANYSCSSMVDAVHVDMEPGSVVSDGAILTGSVVGSKIFTETDFVNLGGSFGNFIKLLPVIMVYDANKNLKAGGLVTPPMSVINSREDALDEAIAQNDYSLFYATFGSVAQGYEIRGLQEGEYILVAKTQNYPPVISTVTIGAAGTTKVVNINFDTQVGMGAVLKGTVVSSTNSAVALTGAAVTIESPVMSKSMSLTTSSTGYYKTDGGLGSGLYNINVSASGYALGKKQQFINPGQAFLGTAVTVDFAMKPAGGSVSGTVSETVLKTVGYIGTSPIKVPKQVGVSGARIIAYDDTATGDEANAAYTTETSSTGAYAFTGLVPTHVYKFFALAEGRQVQTASTQAIDGAITDVDFLLQPKPLDINVSVSQGTEFFTILIKNPNDFADGNVHFEESAGGYEVLKATDVSNSFNNLPDGSIEAFVLLTSLADNTAYILHIEAIDNSLPPKTFIKEVTFGKGIQAVKQSIDQQLTGDPDNDTMVAGDGSYIEFGLGSMISSTTAGEFPTGGLTATSTSTAAGLASMAAKTSFSGTFNSSLFDLVLSSVQFNANRPVTLTFACKANAAEVASLTPYYYNPNTLTWQALSGTLTYDGEAGGTCSIPVDLSTLSGYGIASNGSRGSMNSLHKRNTFAYNPLAGNFGSGSFMVGVAAAGGVAASKYMAYNFPNPFNLVTKTVTLRTGTSGVNTSIRGTYIVVAPTASGTAMVKIFNVAGDLVREISVSVTGSQYNYIEWDGRNDSGGDVASGVYFAVIDAPGAPKKEPVKMVLVK
ncbi:MAG: FlgD immunoglobulin-like domain containing protein [Elusimicrobiota bacterium]